MAGQTLKSALEGRVNISQAQRLASQRQDLGEGAMCAGGHDHYFDEYGRIADQHTLNKPDASCSHYTIGSAQYMQYENNQRPYIAIASPGMNPTDPMGVGRDDMPKNLYGPSYGGFVRHGVLPGNHIKYPRPPPQRVPHRMTQPFDFSHDATSRTFLG